ncbi:MAG TPA: cyclic nucleotide-binding domain-containing protein, partial [Acidobacteria bacterium]|nr:cyclic nucleotide-binding domain-containing protein [Acidobacteriota bacterium]
MDTVHLHPSLLDRLTAIARRLAAVGRPAEAADLLEVAAVLSPQGAHLLDEAESLRQQTAPESLERELKRRNLESSHAIGMGNIFISRGELDRAVEMFDFAKLRIPFHYLAYSASGFLHLKHGDPATALQEFSQARRLNPLDLRLAVETSRAALQLESYRVALEHAIDAMLLSQWETDREQEQDRRRVTTLARLCNTSDKEVDALTRERAKALQKACDHVALSQARIFSSRQLRRRRKAVARRPAERDQIIERASELRLAPVFHHFGDEQLIALARLAHKVDFEEAQVLFREDGDGRDIYLVRSGTVHVTRRTPAGTQVLSTLGKGSLFGEVSFLDGSPRSATAFGVTRGSLYLFLAQDLDQAMAEDRELAVGLLWPYWQTLSDKVRAANAQMNELLAPGAAEVAVHEDHGHGTPVSLSTEEKIEVLHEQGLSAQELRLLATYSQEERFDAEALIFTEGERGDKLYIVVDGQVRI